jgi:glycosyltransferase involved in cell wall biosynthesis
LTDSPLVTVVIPAYNAGPYIQQTVASVLAQTWSRLECLVIDDGSVDDTTSAVAAFTDPRLRVLQQKNGGVSRARNVGIRHARGQLIAFLDADDAWLPNKLRRQIEIMQACPDVGAVLSGYAVADSTLRPRWVVAARHPDQRLKRWLALEGDGPGLGSTLLVRRSVLDRVGGFDESLPPSEDLHFGLRLCAWTSIAAVAEPMVLYRTHARQAHRNLALLERNMLAIYADLLKAPEHEALRRRATANLYARLFFHHLRSCNPRSALAALLRSVEQQPSRVVVLPALVGARRARERLGRLISGPPSLPEQLAHDLPDIREVIDRGHEPSQRWRDGVDVTPAQDDA